MTEDILLDFIMWLDQHYFISENFVTPTTNAFQVMDEYLQEKKKEKEKT